MEFTTNITEQSGIKNTLATDGTHSHNDGSPEHRLACVI